MNGKMNCRLTKMFEYQKELMEKKYPQYKPSSCSDVNSPVNQVIIREYAGWIMEELAEAINECHNENITSHDRYCEELVDGLHFVIELALVMGYTPEQVFPYQSHDSAEPDWLSLVCEMNSTPNCSFNGLVANLVYSLGMFTHCLKNKPWEKDFEKTDTDSILSWFQTMCGDWFSIMLQEMSGNTIYVMFVKQ